MGCRIDMSKLQWRQLHLFVKTTSYETNCCETLLPIYYFKHVSLTMMQNYAPNQIIELACNSRMINIRQKLFNVFGSPSIGPLVFRYNQIGEFYQFFYLYFMGFYIRRLIDGSFFLLLSSLMSFKGKNMWSHNSVKFQKTLFNFFPIIKFSLKSPTTSLSPPFSRDNPWVGYFSPKVISNRTPLRAFYM